MRRLIALVLVFGASVAALAGFSQPRAYGGSSYVVDAIFDTASGLIPQNNVMIAGAKVGTVTRISLTSRYAARVQMQIASRYAPFHADARCQIRPVALIGEMEVECDPGLAAAGPLRPAGGQPPTVALARTTVPVDLTDLFDIWSSPVSQRVSTILWTLGAGLAGRGDDLNAVLQRSNPTLTLARQMITTLNGQRAQLQSLADSSDRLLAQLAPGRGALRQFLAQAAAVTNITAAHREALAEAVHRLPGLLSAAQPALAQLELVAGNATPVLADLQAAAPNLNRMVTEVVPLAAAAEPALTRLDSLARTGLRVLPSLTPLAVQLRDFARVGLPVARLLAALFTSMQQRGFIERLNAFPYYVGSSLSRFDQTSHLSASNFLTSFCGGSAESRYPACSAKYGQTQSASQSASGKRGHRGPAAAASRRGGTAPAGTPPPGTPAGVPAGVPAHLAPLQSLIDFLLK